MNGFPKVQIFNFLLFMEVTYIDAAPGRMDVMGGIADYSGSLVLQMAIQENTVVRFTPREDFLCSVQSTVEGECLKAEIDLRELSSETNLENERIRNFFLKRELKWAP